MMMICQMNYFTFLSDVIYFDVDTGILQRCFGFTVVLLGLLQWQDIMTDTTKLRDHLEKLMKVDGEEIVKVHNSHLRALVKIELILDYELNWFYLKWLCCVTNFKLLSFLFY